MEEIWSPRSPGQALVPTCRIKTCCDVQWQGEGFLGSALKKICFCKNFCGFSRCFLGKTNKQLSDVQVSKGHFFPIFRGYLCYYFNTLFVMTCLMFVLLYSESNRAHTYETVTNDSILAASHQIH